LTTIPQGQVRPKKIQKIDAGIFGKLLFFKNYLLCSEKENLEEYSWNMHLSKGDLPKIIIIRHQGAETDLGIKYSQIWQP
jgi:hypothetical protein